MWYEECCSDDYYDQEENDRLIENDIAEMKKRQAELYREVEHDQSNNVFSNSSNEGQSIHKA